MKNAAAVIEGEFPDLEINLLLIKIGGNENGFTAIERGGKRGKRNDYI